MKNLYFSATVAAPFWQHRPCEGGLVLILTGYFLEANVQPKKVFSKK